jgi:hypothetical protein
VVPQIPETDGARIRRHETEVSQNCGHNRSCPSRARGSRPGRARRSDYQITWVYADDYGD